MPPMDKSNTEAQDLNIRDNNESGQELKTWETPELFVEKTETITESGIFNVNDQDDALYHT